MAVLNMLFIGHLYIFGEMYIQVLCLFFFQLIVFLFLSCACTHFYQYIYHDVL